MNPFLEKWFFGINSCDASGRIFTSYTTGSIKAYFCQETVECTHEFKNTNRGLRQEPRVLGWLRTSNNCVIFELNSHACLMVNQHPRE